MAVFSISALEDKSLMSESIVRLRLMHVILFIVDIFIDSPVLY